MSRPPILFRRAGLSPGTHRPLPEVARAASRDRASMVAEACGFALAALLVAASLASSAAAEPWTLDRFLDRVRSGDPGVRAARAGGAAGRAQAAQMWAQLSPHVAVSSGFTRTDDPAILFSQKLWQGRFTPADFDVARLNQPDARDALQWNVTVDQPLFNGGRELTAPFVSAHYSRAASAMERANVAKELLAAVEAYVGAARARDDSEAAGQSLAAASAMRTAAVERYRMGQVPELDTLMATSRFAAARVRAIGAHRSLAVALDHVSRLAQATIAADDVALPETLPTLSERAETARGELAAAREGAKAAGTESHTAGLQLLPSFNSRLAVSQYKPWTGGTFERRWMVAVMAELPIFDGAQRLNAYRAARAKATQARASAQALERDMAVALAGARAEDAVSREAREAARDGRVAAEEALRLASLRYRAGLLPLSELLAADAQASGARASETEASSAMTLAHYRLLFAQGELR